MSDHGSDTGAKILIAEDDAIVALDLQGMVTRLGYDVVQIVDSSQVLLNAALRFRPDIVIVDMNLSGTPDVIEVTSQIHESLDIPVVFCVGVPDLSLLARTKHLDYTAYLMKPVNPDSLSNTLDTILYKNKLERRVREAERIWTQLSDKCRVLQFFRDHSLAFRWSWVKDGGVRMEDADQNAALFNQSIERCIHEVTLTSDEFSWFSRLIRNSDNLHPPALVLAVPEEDSAGYVGLVIPVQGESVF